MPCGCDEEASCPHVRPEWLEYGVACETWPGSIMELGKVLGAIDPERGVFELSQKSVTSIATSMSYSFLVRMTVLRGRSKLKLPKISSYE